MKRKQLQSIADNIAQEYKLKAFDELSTVVDESVVFKQFADVDVQIKVTAFYKDERKDVIKICVAVDDGTFFKSIVPVTASFDKHKQE